MATTKTKGKNKDASLAKQLIAGTSKHLSTMKQLMFDGATYTPAQVAGELQKLVTLRSDVEDARAALHAKLEEELANLGALIAFLNAFVAFVKATFGNKPDVLADFGLKPKKVRTPLTVEQKAAAHAKAASTRSARHTTGSKKRLAVKGDVTGVVVTPVTAPKPAGGNGTPHGA
jgi:hypothetical protein